MYRTKLERLYAELEKITERKNRYYAEQDDFANTTHARRIKIDIHLSSLHHDLELIEKQILELEACEHTEYDEHLDGLIVYRVCFTCEKVTPVELSDEAI